jgi:hypothetical protein
MRRGSRFFAAALRLFALAALLSCFAPGAATFAKGGETALHPSSPAVKKELTTVIEGQLAAFRANDYRKAYTFASAEIQQLFPVAEFETMVRHGFPVIAESSTAEFGLALDTGDEAVVTVRVENTAKRSIAYQYHLKKEDGRWRIAGVTEVKEEGLVV